MDLVLWFMDHLCGLDCRWENNVLQVLHRPGLFYTNCAPLTQQNHMMLENNNNLVQFHPDSWNE